MATSGKPLSDHERERVKNLRDKGVRVSEIAKREFISEPTVRKILNSAVDKFRSGNVR